LRLDRYRLLLILERLLPVWLLVSVIILRVALLAVYLPVVVVSAILLVVTSVLRILLILRLERAGAWIE